MRRSRRRRGLERRVLGMSPARQLTGTGNDLPRHLRTRRHPPSCDLLPIANNFWCVFELGRDCRSISRKQRLACTVPQWLFEVIKNGILSAGVILLYSACQVDSNDE